MTQPIDPTELAETLRDWCVDYDGEHITPEAEPRTIPTCAELRQVANTILAQAARIEALEAALKWAMVLAEMALGEAGAVRARAGHKIGENGLGPYCLYESEIADRDKARAALKGTRNAG